MQPLLHGDDDQIDVVSGCRFFQLIDHQWNAYGSVEVVAYGLSVVFLGLCLALDLVAFCLTSGADISSVYLLKIVILCLPQF